MSHWVIVAKLGDVGMGIQEMVDAMPEEGGTLNLSAGTYWMDKPLTIPKDSKKQVNITGCVLYGDKKESRVIHPGNVEFVGSNGSSVYWNGSSWKAFDKDALKFKTQDEAVTAAIILVTKKPDLIGKVSVEELSLWRI